MTRALLVPVEGPPTEVGFPDGNPGAWAGLIGAVSGCDFITLRESGLQVIVDDRSLLDGRPINPRVTWFLKGTGRYLSEVAGTVLIIGVGEGGETVDVHPVLMEALIRTP